MTCEIGVLPEAWRNFDENAEKLPVPGIDDEAPPPLQALSPTAAAQINAIKPGCFNGMLLSKLISEGSFS